jgi:Tfp pilus assembly protein PilF
MIKEYISQQPDDEQAYLLLAETYEAMDKDAEALEQLKIALEKSPGDPNINLTIAEHYRMRRDYDSAMPYLKAAFASTDLDVDSKIKILLGLFLISESRTEIKADAYELLDAAVMAHPNDPKVYSMYGDFCFRDKKYQKAGESFRKAIALDNSKFAVWSQLLIVESELGDFDAMIREAEQAKEIFPNEPGVMLFLGIARLQKKQPKEAAESLNEGLKLVIDNPPLEAQFYANLGDAYYRLKEYGKSDDAYESALKINPEDTYVLNNYAYYLSLRKEKLERAAEMSKKTVDMNPGNSSYLDTYGWILYTQGKFSEAEQWIGKAVKASSSPSAVILEHYGDVWYQLKDTNKALEYWRRAKEAGPASDLLDQKIRDQKLIE